MAFNRRHAWFVDGEMISSTYESGVFCVSFILTFFQPFHTDDTANCSSGFPWRHFPHFQSLLNCARVPHFRVSHFQSPTCSNCTGGGGGIYLVVVESSVVLVIGVHQLSVADLSPVLPLSVVVAAAASSSTGICVGAAAVPATVPPLAVIHVAVHVRVLAATVALVVRPFA